MKIYTCPMHLDVRRNKPGRCPKCGMELVLEGSTKISKEQTVSKDSYSPLIIIISLISLVTLAITIKDSELGNFNLGKTMSYLMSGFFLVFSGFKLMDLKGFAGGYSSYDLLAQRVFQYGYIYPFIELIFGISYILNPQSKLLSISTIFIMLFSGIGVAIKIAKKEKFQCACLGTFLKIPLTKVTLVEDFGMALMALFMLLIK